MKTNVKKPFRSIITIDLNPDSTNLTVGVLARDDETGIIEKDESQVFNLKVVPFETAMQVVCSILMPKQQ